MIVACLGDSITAGPPLGDPGAAVPDGIAAPDTIRPSRATVLLGGLAFRPL